MTRWTWLGLVLAMSMLLAGCGAHGAAHARPVASASTPGSGSTEFAGLPPATILRQSLAALTGASTLRVQLKAQGTHYLVVDLRRSPSGDCVGTLTVDGVRAALILTDANSYYRGSARYWHASTSPRVSAIMAKHVGLWARFSTNSFLLDLCRATELVKTLRIPSKNLRDLHASTPYPSTEGRTVVNLTTPDSELEFGVDAASPHYLLEIHALGATAQFSDFGAPVSVTIPGPSEYIPFAEGDTAV